jgi:hypothetical protein
MGACAQLHLACALIQVKPHVKPMTSGFTLHLMKRFSNLKCSFHLISHFKECSPSVVVNGEFMCSELHGTFH